MILLRLRVAQGNEERSTEGKKKPVNPGVRKRLVLDPIVNPLYTLSDLKIRRLIPFRPDGLPEFVLTE